MLLLSTAIGVTMSQNALTQGDAPTVATLQPPDANLQPGVREFIADNYLAHATEYPDPNEPVELRSAVNEFMQAAKIGMWV